jgi:hypothetical protein
MIDRRASILLTGLGVLSPWPLIPLQAEPRRLLALYGRPVLLDNIFMLGPRHDCDAEGACARNRFDLGQVEDQRSGAESIITGVLTNRRDWVERGWQMLDWAIRHQRPDGLFPSRGAEFHSSSLFQEALARALIVDPGAATPERLGSLRRGAKWLVANDDAGLQLNRKYTHRNYVLTAALGQSAVLLGDASFAKASAMWARRGLAAQWADGVNPELSGYDVSYQMVGPLFALRYYPNCPDVRLRQELSTMVVKAVSWWLRRLDAEGGMDLGKSTRVGKENQENGKPKIINYVEALQVLVFGGVLIDQPEWLSMADKLISPARRQLGLPK